MAKPKAAPTSKPKKLKRKYTPQTLKIIFALSGNQCARPGCSNPLIADKTPHSNQKVVSHIAHIFALNVNGPRGKVGLTEAELNQPSNLILLCPTDHTVVDEQHETYPASMLFKWKEDHERKYVEAISYSINDIGFAELEVAAQSLLSKKLATPTPIQVIPPEEKIQKNSLGSGSSMLLTMGAAKSSEVADLLIRSAQLNPEFPERLRAGFVDRYNKAKAKGMSGDTLFAEMHGWAGGNSSDVSRQSAGLCILSHLFVICDVFEK